MLKGWLPAASRLLIIEEGVVIITQTIAQVGTFPDIVHLARIMVVIGPVTLRDLGKQCFSLISKGPSCYLCQLVLIENFVVTFSLVSTGEDAVIVLNIKMFLPVLRIFLTHLSLTVLVGQTAGLVVGTEVGGITGGRTTSVTSPITKPKNWNNLSCLLKRTR